MRKILVGAALATGLATSANANITVTAFSASAYQTMTANAYTDAIEDFEAIGNNQPLTDGATTPHAWNNGFQTAVGLFSPITPSGNAGTCSQLGGDCSVLALSDRGTFGQGNAWPTNGTWSLNSNDHAGIRWEAKRRNGGTFGTAIFTLTDAADVGNNVLRITTNSTEGFQQFNLDGYGNNDVNIFKIAFGANITSADIRILTLDKKDSEKLVTNDSMSIDGLALAPVPLPAAGWVLLSGIAGLLAVRRARRAA